MVILPAGSTLDAVLLYFYALRPGQRFPEPDTHRMLVGAALRAARLRAGLSLVQVVDAVADGARGAGRNTRLTTSTGSLSRHESGRTPITMELFDALAITYDVQPTVLHRLIADAWLGARDEVEGALKSARRLERLVEHFREQLDTTETDSDPSGVARGAWPPNESPSEVSLQSPWQGGPPTSTLGMLDDLQPGVSWTELLPLDRDPTSELTALAAAAAASGLWRAAIVGPTRRALDRARVALDDLAQHSSGSELSGVELVGDLRAVRWLIAEPTARISGAPPSRLLLVDGGPTLVRLRVLARREGLEWPPPDAAVVTFESPLDGGPQARCDLGRSPSKLVKEGFGSGRLAPFEAWLSEGPVAEPHGFSRLRAKHAGGPQQTLLPGEILRRIEDPRVPLGLGRTVVYCASKEDAEALQACLQARGAEAMVLHRAGRDEVIRQFAATPQGWLCATRRLNRFDTTPPVASIVLAVRTHPRSLPARVLPLLHTSRGGDAVQIIELIEPGDRRSERAWKALARGVEDRCAWHVVPAGDIAGPTDAESP